MNTQPATPSPGRRPNRTPVTFLALAGAGILAAGVGGYVAQSQRQAELSTVEARPAQAQQTAPATPAPATRDPLPVQPEPAPVAEAPAPDMAAAPAAPEPVERPAARPQPATRATADPRPAKPAQTVRAGTPAPASQTPPPAPATRTPDPAPAEAAPEAPVAQLPPPAPVEPVERPQPAKVTITDTFTVPPDSVMGLEIERNLSSETAQLEDRVDARVTRDLKVDGTIVIPAGARVRGDVVQVEHGGRFKERARLGIRFHTLVLADGTTIDIETEPLIREGESVGRKAGTRIGASAAGGAIIGAIFGGEKGAAIGAAAGAGAGTAVTAAQKPSEARFRAGSVVTVRLTAPVSITLQQ